MGVDYEKVRVSLELPKALVQSLDEVADMNRRSRTGEIEVRLKASFEEAEKQEGGAT